MNQAAPGGAPAFETIEDVLVLTKDKYQKTHLSVRTANWDRDRQVFTVDSRDPHTGIGEVWTYPAANVISTRSMRRKV